MELLLAAELPAKVLEGLLRLGIRAEQDKAGASLEQSIERAGREEAVVMVPATPADINAGLLERAPGVIGLAKGAWDRSGLKDGVLGFLRGFHPEPFLRHICLLYGAGPTQAVIRSYKKHPTEVAITLPWGTQEEFLHCGFNGVEELRKAGIALGGVTRTVRGYFVERRPSAFHLLGYIEKGELEIVPEGAGIVRAAAGSCLLLEAGFRGFYRANRATQFLWFCLRNDHFGLPAEGRTLVSDHPRTQPLVQVARQFFEECRLETPERALVLLRLVQLMETQIHRVLRAMGLPLGVDHVREQILKAIRKVEENPASSWSVGQLARVAGLSTARLYREIRSHFRQTPGSMVQQIRIRRAAEQLWQSGQKLQQVAALTGYSDSFSFSRAFKRVMGVSPSQYRAGWKKGDRQSELVPVPSSWGQREMSPVSARKKSHGNERKRYGKSLLRHSM